MGECVNVNGTVRNMCVSIESALVWENNITYSKTVRVSYTVWRTIRNHLRSTRQCVVQCHRTSYFILWIRVEWLSWPKRCWILLLLICSIIFTRQCVPLFTFFGFFFIFVVDILFYLTICRGTRTNNREKGKEKPDSNRNDRDSPERNNSQINRSVKYETFLEYMIKDLSGKKTLKNRDEQYIPINKCRRERERNIKDWIC